MTHKATSLKSVIPELLGVALGMIVLAAIVYLNGKFVVRADHVVVGDQGNAELPNADGRLSRLHLLLSK
jgi:hypothetical protein